MSQDRLPAPSSQDRSLIRKVLPTVRLFRPWPAQHVQTLADATRVLRFPSGQVLVAQRQALNGIYVIGTGSIEVGSMHLDGRRYVRRYARVGMLFGLVSVLDGKGSPYTYITHEPATVLFIPKATFLSLLSRHPEMWASVARFVASFQRMALSAIDEHMFVALRVRLNSALVALAKSQCLRAGSADTIAVRITQDELASLLGVSRQSISKGLKQLEREGVIKVEYRKISLVDYQAVERIAQRGNGLAVPEE